MTRPNPARMPGETNQDCIARLSGQLRAAEMDRDRLAAQRTAVLAVHYLCPAAPAYDPYCSACSYEEGWPCPTAKALGVEA